MEPEIIFFVPNGDVTLKLVRNVYEEEDQPPAYRLRRTLSTVQQTPIHEDKELELDDAALDEVLEDESLLFYAPEPPNASDGPLYPPTPRGMRGSDASSRRDRSSSPPASFWANLKRQQASRNNEVIEEEEEAPIPEQTQVKKEKVLASSHEVHCVVSSRHMRLASQVFEDLLTGNSTEAKTLRSKGHVTITVLADLDTVIILLNIIHGPSRKVPRQVTLLELSNLATLVSHFGMIETVQFFSDTWIDALQREGLPKTYTQDVLRLLFVFWVFDRPEEFKNMTRLAQRECDENLLEDVKGLPIPHNIIDAIKKEREYAIETAITTLHTLITRYMNGNIICDATLEEDLQYACDAMVLGCLMKSSRKIGLWPRPQAPFEGQKFKDIARTIRSIKILDVCNRSSRRHATFGTSSNCHGLEDELEVAMKGIEVGLDGLELLAYAKKSEQSTSGFEMFALAPEEEEVVPPVEEIEVPTFQSYVEEEDLTPSADQNGAQDSRDFHKEEETIPISKENEVHDSLDHEQNEEVIRSFEEDEQDSRDYQREEEVTLAAENEILDSRDYHHSGEDLVLASEVIDDLHNYSMEEKILPASNVDEVHEYQDYADEPATPLAEFHEPSFRTYTPERVLVPESQLDGVKCSQREYSMSEPRLRTPQQEIHFEEEGVKLVQESPMQSPQQSQQSQQSFYQNDSRDSSRASDYQVQEPVLPVVKEEQKPVVSRNSPSQDWMNHGRVVTKPTSEYQSVRERDNMRSPVEKEREESKPSVERRSNRTIPTQAQPEDSKKSNGNGNGHGNGHGQHNGNGAGNGASSGASRSGHVTPSVASVEEIVEVAPRVQPVSRIYHHDRSSFERNPIEERVEKTSSNEKMFQPSPKALQVEKAVPVEKQSEKVSPNERILYSSRSAQNEKTIQPEKSVQPESTARFETASYTAKKSAPIERVPYSETGTHSAKSPAGSTQPPELPVHQPQRTSYSAQSTHSGRSSQIDKPISSTDRPNNAEKKAYNGKVKQAEVNQQQKSVQNEKSVSHVEKVASPHERSAPSSHSSYNNGKSSQHDNSQQHRPTTNGKSTPQSDRSRHQSPSPSHNGKSSEHETPQQYKTTTNGKSIAQVERQNPQSPSPSQNSKPVQQVSSQPQQKSQPTPPPPSKTTSPAPPKHIEEPTKKEITPSETSPTTVIDENWGQPQKFMRKSKKKFTNRF